MNKYTLTFVLLLLCFMFCLTKIGCAVYPNITMGYDSCPYYCGVEHRHKTHSEGYDCGQETCIHMITKRLKKDE